MRTAIHALYLLATCWVYDRLVNASIHANDKWAKRLIGAALWLSWRTSTSRMAFDAPDHIAQGWEDLYCDAAELNAEAHLLHLV